MPEEKRQRERKERYRETRRELNLKLRDCERVVPFVCVCVCVYSVYIYIVHSRQAGRSLCTHNNNAQCSHGDHFIPSSVIRIW